MGPCVCRHFREPDAGEKKESSIKFFTKRPSERGALSFTRTLDIEISVYRYTFHVHWVLFSQGSDLWIRNTHLWFVESTQSLFHPQSVKRGMLGKKVCYKCIRSNVHYIMWPACFTESHFLSLLPAVPHIKQPWPLQYDPSFKVFNEHHFSTCFSRRTSWLFLIGRTFPTDVNIWTFLCSDLFFCADTVRSAFCSFFKYSFALTINLTQCFVCEAGLLEMSHTSLTKCETLKNLNWCSKKFYRHNLDSSFAIWISLQKLPSL